MISTITLITTGFSLVIAGLLLVVYLFFMKNLNKSRIAVVSGIFLLGGLSCLQFEHMQMVLHGGNPLETFYYRFLLFLLPTMFFFFSRAILFGSGEFKGLDILHLTPLLMVFLVKSSLAVPLAFIIGAGYSLWLVHLLYSVRRHRKRFELEFFFFGFFAVLAVVVLLLAFSLTYIEQSYFYYFYANGIGLSFLLVTGSLIVSPDLLRDLTDVVKLSYANSTLSNVDVGQQLKKLESLMNDERLYQNENLTLGMLAQSMALTSHQLSELINREFDVSFSRYIREQRIDAAKQLLRQELDSSVLAISLETGFKSQSNFYAAFKEITGQSPGQYRKSNRS